jgi:hypothetical protein
LRYKKLMLCAEKDDCGGEQKFFCCVRKSGLHFGWGRKHASFRAVDTTHDVRIALWVHEDIFTVL